MDVKQFDTITKLFADRRVNRRAAVLGTGAGIAAIGLASARHANAQDATPAASPVPSIRTNDVKAETDPSFMFVQSFESGQMTPVAGTKDTFTLALQHGGGQTVYFSDRPERIFGAAPTGKFIDGLPFEASNPPNAALVMKTANSDADVVVLELTDPTYDESASLLNYTAKVLSDYSDFDTTLQSTPEDAASVSTSFAGASLFIDDCADSSLWCFTPAGLLICHAQGLVTGIGMCWSFEDFACNICHGTPTSYCTATYPDCANDSCNALTQSEEASACG